MRLAFLGTGAFAVPALRELVAAGHEVRVVISQPDRPAGRGKQVKASFVHAAADDLSLRHVQTESVNTEDFATLFEDAELGVVAAFGQKLSPALLGALPRGFINIHGSLLPKYRGAAPFQWAILRGERETGITIFQLDAEWDAGPIYCKRSLEIGVAETATELHDRLALLGAEAISEVVAGIEGGGLSGAPQDSTAATRAPKLQKSDGIVDWSRSAEAIRCQINGLWSWPSAVSGLQRPDGAIERVQLCRATRAEPTTAGSSAASATPGTILDERYVACGDGPLELLEVKPAGGRQMTFAALFNGRRLEPGARFVPLETE